MDKLANLGIDLGSIIFYIINFGIVLAVLSYLLYKPILKFIDQRRDEIKNSIQEAEKLKKTFEEGLAKSEAERKKVESELRMELDNLHKFTNQKKTEMIAEMEVARTSMLQKAQEEIDMRKAGIIKDAEDEVKKLMTRIILQIVENKVPEDVIQDSIKSAWNSQKTMK